jgi:hypothetical protein
MRGGLQLGGAVFGGGGVGYNPAAVPTAANQPTGTTISRAAFGINSGADGPGHCMAGTGTTAVAVGCALVLTWLWWTLPR